MQTSKVYFESLQYIIEKDQLYKGTAIRKGHALADLKANYKMNASTLRKVRQDRKNELKKQWKTNKVGAVASAVLPRFFDPKNKEARQKLKNEYKKQGYGLGATIGSVGDPNPRATVGYLKNFKKKYGNKVFHKK